MILAEQETTITYDSEEKLVRIFSARAGDQGKLERAGYAPLKGSQPFGFFYQLPLSQLRWRAVPLGKVRAKKVLPLNHPFLGSKSDRKGIPDGN